MRSPAVPQKVTRGISGLQSVSAEICFLCQQSVECTVGATVAVFTEPALPLVGEQEFKKISKFLICEQGGVAVGHGGNC